MSPPNLLQLLQRAASASPQRGLSFYAPGKTDAVSKSITYNELFQTAKANAQVIRSIPGVTSSSVVLLHFNNHSDNIEWFWAVVAAGLVPCISTPLTNDTEGRQKHITHLQNILDSPIILTTKALRADFSSVKTVNIQTIEELAESSDHGSSSSEPDESSSASSDKDSQFFNKTKANRLPYGSLKKPGDVAALMLTSGSSGNSKAVCLRHEQILAAISGKSSYHETNSDDVFLNWIGLDHVANLTEVHLHAMHLAAQQYHIQAADLLAQPELYLDLIDKHRVAYSFAPNFYMATLKRTLESPESTQGKSWDLSCLRALISGGESNVTETAQALTKLTSKYGTPYSYIRPGFGMTETCAGSIYSKTCPESDVENGREFSALGQCVPGLSMRVTSDEGEVLGQNEIGNLELSGPLLFKEYRNNPTATAESFTSDGWFITGDRAYLDNKSHLVLTGRSKETIIVNGVKYFPHELESAIEEASIAGATPSFTAVFPHRPKGSDTEVMVVVYLPTYSPEDIDARVSTSDQIAKCAVMQSGTRPYAIIPLTKALLPKTSLGKLSRAKLRTAFESGLFNTYREADEAAIKAYRAERIEVPSNEVEEAILSCFVRLFNVPREEVGLSTSLFDWGVSSIEIIKLKTLIQRELKLEEEIPVITVMSNPTIKGLAAAVKTLQEPHVYNPVVTLQAGGSKTPIFLVHPGVGEVLVFLNLAKYITDRPVHAIRARGFDEGEEYFKDIPEVVETYYNAIKKTQPVGPYALAGYSYGSMLAFEVTKKLQAGGDEVGFLGSLNLPPHIKFRMRQLDWIEVLLNLSYFLDLISDDYAHAISADMHKLTHSEVLDFIISKAPGGRMEEMALDKKKLENWAELAYVMQAIAQDYDPSGHVTSMDVFYAIPLSAVAKSKTDWMENHLIKWQEFVDTPVRFTEVEGAHYTMMGPDHVLSFSKRFRAAIAARGL